MQAPVKTEINMFQAVSMGPTSEIESVMAPLHGQCPDQILYSNMHVVSPKVGILFPILVALSIHVKAWQVLWKIEQ